ncbi:MAG: winged helix-turn-helix domain-containing protein [Clostridia bacterium]|nr:winged helix-turn-helix domain-containing protein [Clostridia bacterium]
MEELKEKNFCSSLNEHCPVSSLKYCKECLGDTEIEILSRIYENENITADDIYNMGGISRAGVAHRIEELKNKGILTERNDNGKIKFAISKPCYELCNNLSDKDWNAIRMI